MKPSPLGNNETLVVLAVVAGGRSFRDVAGMTGLNLTAVWRAAAEAKAAGLIVWTPGLKGTLRPTVEVVGVF